MTCRAEDLKLVKGSEVSAIIKASEIIIGVGEAFGFGNRYEHEQFVKAVHQ